MPNEYSLQELAKLSDVTPRTIRFYIEQGLLAAPTALGPRARYTDDHLDRLRIIKKLQAGHLPLAEIRARLRGVAAGEHLPEPAQVNESALDYINQLLHPLTSPPPPPPAASMAAPSAPAVAYRQLSVPAPSELPEPAKASEPTKTTEPERAQWERIALDPDIEIHIRRPLTRQQNKRVERLISIARQLLEE
ncbi:MAG TPA: MerR family transcriptional regulator [Candidatus Limnocylindrales bacterium]|nr:MerR family transcriptional regulator [Candidatus Limnocylindrales bacterium]